MIRDISEFPPQRGGDEDFATFLRSAPDADLEVDRQPVPARVVDLGDAEFAS